MRDAEENTPPPFTVYAVGVCHASVCTSLGDADAEYETNAAHPTFIASRWVISGEDFPDGTKNGTPCHDAPDRMPGPPAPARW